MTENEISKIIIGAAIEVHKILGPGLLESAYEFSLYKELIAQGVNVKKQVELPLVYKNATCNVGYRIDLLVENKVIVEIKSVEAINNIYIAQLLTYLKLSKCTLGLIINFNVSRLSDGIKRVVNKLKE